MSRQSRRAAARQPSAIPPIGNPQAAAPTTIPGYSGGYGTNGHQGALNSRARGYVYFPQLDTRREITTYTRTELLRKARFLYANHGIAKRVVNGLARMVAGTGLAPQAATKDIPWNALAEKEFARRAESPFVFDVGGRYDFYKSQQALMRFRFRDGDCSAILTESASGLGRLAFYEGHQIGSAQFLPPGFAPNEWHDGVRTDANGAATHYRYLDYSQTFPLGYPTSFTDVAAQNVIFFADYERAGQSRSLTIFAHAINNLLDTAEITAYIKQGVKLSNQYGYWIERAATNAGTPSFTGAGNTQQIAVSDSENLTVERVYGGGQIPDLKPGEQLKFNTAAHPHPNQLTLLEFLIRDIAWGVGVSPELLWNITALGGANTRFVLADAQGWIEEQQADLVRLYCQRVWVYFIAKSMKAGRLPPCQDPEWWQCNWITPPRLTVDFGRDGKLQLEQLKMGVITYSRLLGWQGQDFETHTNQWLNELKFVKAGMDSRGLTWADLQSWRNVNAMPSALADAATTEASSPGEDGLPNDPAQANEALSALLKKSGGAEKFLAHLRAQPEAA
ncbi:MAG: phage portal protein [Undibacterium sp.]|nr:phage portal protein [Opitutaceae bacterium]